MRGDPASEDSAGADDDERDDDVLQHLAAGAHAPYARDVVGERPEKQKAHARDVTATADIGSRSTMATKLIATTSLAIKLLTVARKAARASRFSDS